MAQHARVLAARLTLTFVALALVAVAFGGRSSQAAPAPQRAPVSLAPPQLPPVSLGGGAFTLWVAIDDLDHQGRIGYDQDRDTVPDRFEPSIGFGGFEFTLDYDPALLDVQAANAGDLAGDSSRSFQCLEREDEPGSFSFGCFSGGEGPGRQGSFTLAEVRVMPVGSGASVIRLGEIQLSGPLGDDVSIQVSNSASVIDIARRGGSPDDGKADKNPDDSKNPSDDQTTNGGGAGHPQDSNTGGTSNSPGDVSNEPGLSGEAGGQPGLQGGGGSQGDSTGDGTTSGAQAGAAGSADGGGGWTIALWSALVAGGAVAAGGLGIAAFRWRRMRAGE